MKPAVSSRVWTIPNVLSFLLVTEQYGWAVLVIAASSATDFVDGYVARHFNQISRLGQLLDPAADRLFILTTLLGLAFIGALPWWFVAALIARDALLIVLGIVLANHRYGPLPVHHLGKMGTFAVLFAMPVLLLAFAVHETAWIALPLGWAAAIWGLFLYWWAGVAYALQAVRMIRDLRVAGAASSDTVDR
jgi:cardiolipin synthase (CMP-forming)